MKKSILCVLIILGLLIQLSFSSSAQEMILIEEYVPMMDENGVYYNSYSDVLGTCSSTSLPEAYDSRSLGIITPVKAQGNSNCCWSYSVVAALEANAIKRGLISADDADFSEAHLSWFSHNSISSDENDVSGKDGTNNAEAYQIGGNSRIAEFTLARGCGIALEKDFPFYPYNLSLMNGYEEKDRYNHGSGLALETTRCFSVNDITGMKAWIMENGAITIQYAHDESLMSAENGYYNPVSFEASPSNFRHEIAIVGWDDNFATEKFASKSQPRSDGAWLCKNSWGTSWGDGGYFWMSYEDKSIINPTGFTVFEDIERFNTYNHSGNGYNGFLDFNEEVKGVNVFTAKANEKITSVSTWHKCGEVTVEVSVYTDIPVNSLPVRGTLALKESFRVDGESGFNVFELSESVVVDKGEKYAVMITYPNVSGKSSVPAEGPVANCTSNKDESYIFNSSGSYLDISESGYNNVCIYAATECIHKYETINETAANCVTQGEKTDKCSQCRKITTELTPLSNHTFGEWKKIHGATAVNEGREERLCEECGYVDVKTSPKLSDNGYKVVYIDEIIDMIFERLFEILLFYMNLIEI